MSTTSAFPSQMPGSIRQALTILRRARAVGRERVGETAGSGAMEETISKVVELLRASGASWALVGAHAIGYFTEPRATVDFDFVVEEGRLSEICRRLETVFGELDVVDMGPALRLRNLDVDLIRSGTHPLFGEALAHNEERGGWRIPKPEVLVALKFLSAVSPWRGRTKQIYDIADIRALVTTVGIDRLDRPLMTELAAKVYPGAEKEFSGLVEAIEKGDPITL